MGKISRKARYRKMKLVCGRSQDYESARKVGPGSDPRQGRMCGRARRRKDFRRLTKVGCSHVCGLFAQHMAAGDCQEFRVRAAG